MRSYAIIPAAGRSDRMGRHKLLLPWKDGSLIDSVLAAWRASRVTRIVVVVRAHDEQLAEACGAAGADVVAAESDPPEMKISVGLGLAHVERVHEPGADDVWLLAPADTPRISATTVDRLLDAHDAAAPAILAPAFAGRRGHPVLFPWPLAREVRRLSSNEGVNALLARHPVRPIACGDPGILEDLDTPDDYERLRRLE
jgi:molybdenum cofactor cytidylyltransferase